MGFFDRFKSGKTPPGARPPTVAVSLAAHGSGLVDAMASFGLELAAAGSAENVVCSGFSVLEAWLRVWAGARGTCRAELDRAFGLGDEGEVRAELRELTAAIEAAANDECVVRSANAIWARRGLRLDAGFDEVWGGATREIDFTNAEQAARAVNQWVEERTNGLIRNIVDPMRLSPATAMMLTNAVYLNAKWMTPFPNPAWDAPFNGLRGTATMPMMTLRADLACAETADFALMRKPYRGGGLEMIVVLPRDDRFQEVQRRLGYGAVLAAMRAAKPVDTLLRLPKFAIESAPDVDPLIQRRGATAVYSQTGADLTGLSPDARKQGEELFVGSTTHRARIDVNEEGTEAAAATVVDLIAGSAPMQRPPPYEFFADRPFLYFVVEATSGVPLFSGHFVGP